MKKLRRVIALLLSVMMLMSTQGMMVLAKTQYDNTAEGDVLTETDSADEEDDSTGRNWDATAEGELAEENETERISETLPIEPVTSSEQTSEVERINETLSVEPASTDDLTSAAERINETLPVEPLASSTAGTSAAERINETMQLLRLSIQCIQTIPVPGLLREKLCIEQNVGNGGFGLVGNVPDEGFQLVLFRLNISGGHRGRREVVGQLAFQRGEHGFIEAVLRKLSLHGNVQHSIHTFQNPPGSVAIP